MLRLAASCLSTSVCLLVLGCGGNVVFVEDGAGGGGAGGSGAGTTNVATSVTNATSSETVGTTTSTTSSSSSSTGGYCTNESCYFEVCDCYADCF
ncbi:MAG TPA: hypothetical protein VL400_00710, partial [Polyangiaceae bacterium]|nr:hypothetical protein [Polyangiaceae bacterium]